MAVDKHGPGLGVDDLLGIDHRVALGRHDLGTVGARLYQSGGKPLGTCLHVALVRRLRADRRYTQQIEQLTEESIFVLLDINFYIIHIS